MLRISLFSALLLFLSCNTTKEPALPVDLISKLETVVLQATPTHDYFKILSEIDSLERVDLIPDLKRIDSLIIQEWVIPSSKTPATRNYISPFYIQLREKLSNTIFSLVMVKKGCVTNEERYIYARDNLNRNYPDTSYQIPPGYSFIGENIDIFAPLIKNSFLDEKNLNRGNRDFLLSTFEKAIKKFGNENTKEIVAEQIVEILASSEHKKLEKLFSCRLIYLLGISKAKTAKEFILKAEKQEQNLKIRDCMVSSLKYWFDVDI